MSNRMPERRAPSERGGPLVPASPDETEYYRLRRSVYGSILGTLVWVVLWYMLAMRLPWLVAGLRYRATWDVAQATVVGGWTAPRTHVTRSYYTRSKARTTDWAAILEYDYRAQGRVYRDHSMLSVHGSRTDAEARVRSHPPGSPVPVFYNPADPRGNYVTPPPDLTEIWLSVILALMVVLTVRGEVRRLRGAIAARGQSS